MNPGPDRRTGSDDLRGRMRTDLVSAMRARQPDVVRALRTAIAAIDNAEAVDTGDALFDVTSEHVAGGRAGVGAAEAERRDLSTDDVVTILEALIAELSSEANAFERHNNSERAYLLRREADTLRAYVD